MEEVVLVEECLSLWLIRQRHVVMPWWGVRSSCHSHPLKPRSPVHMSSV